MSGGRADSEIKVKFVTEHDGSGADAANRKLDDTKKKAGEAAGGFAKAGKAAQAFKGAMEMANSAMASFGIAALVTKIFELIEAFDDARRKHKAMVDGINSGNAKATVDGLKGAYDELKESIAAANAETANAIANTDLLVDAERRLQDATLSRREENEVAGLDKNDPLLKEKEAAVRAKYGQQRAGAAGRRGVEDVENQEKTLREEIARLEAQASAREQTAAEFESSAKEYSGRAGDANALAAKYGRQAKAGLFGAGRYIGYKWKVKDTDQYAKHAGAYTQQAAEAFAGAAGARKDADADRAAIKAAQDRLAVLPKVREAAEAEGDVDSRKAARASETAGEAVAEAARRRERERRDLEQARRDNADAEKRKRSLEGGLSAAKNNVDQESQEAWRARQAMEAHESNRPSGGGGKKFAAAGTALRSAWEKEQTEADAAIRSAEALGEATAKSMETVNAILSKSAARMKSIEAKLNKDAYGDNGAGG